MKPTYKEYQDDLELVAEVENQVAMGVDKDNLYVLSHDDDRTKRIADKVDANEINIKEAGLKESISNVFRKKGDELRSKLHEIGFTKEEANHLEEKMDHGKILLIIKA